jgi:hypothetical protein
VLDDAKADCRAAPVSPAYPLAPDLAPDGEAVPEWRAMFGDPRL